jgi:hypothetical protein
MQCEGSGEEFAADEKESIMNLQSTATKNQAVFTTARRVNQALTAPMEKRALQWMAERAPRWLSSDQLTLLGFTAQVGAGIFYALSRFNRSALLLVIFCIALNWLGASALWLLRGSHGGYLWFRRTNVRPCLLWFSALADGDCNADCVSAAVKRELPCYLHALLLSTFAGNFRPHGDSHPADHWQSRIAAQSLRESLRAQDTTL